jgi:hypothetical protein
VPARLTALLAAASLVAVLGGVVVVVAASVAQERSAELPPLPLGSALLTLSGPMTPAEQAVVDAVGPVAHFASAGVPDPADPDPAEAAVAPSLISVASPMLRCLERAGQLLGALDTSTCVAEHPESTLIPGVGIAEFTDVAALTGIGADPAARAAYAAGGAVVVSGVVEPGAVVVDLVRLPGSAEATAGLVPVASVPVVARSVAPQYAGLPTVYLAPTAAEELGLIVLDGQVFVPPAPPALGVLDRVTAAVPVRYQGDLVMTTQGPEVDGVAQARTVALGAVAVASLVAATVLACGTALWNTESRPELSRIAVAGAGRRWMVRYGALHGTLLGGLTCAVAAAPAAAGAAIFLSVAGVPPTVPVPALLALVACVVAMSAAAGASVTPRRVAHRQTCLPSPTLRLWCRPVRARRPSPRLCWADSTGPPTAGRR